MFMGKGKQQQQQHKKQQQQQHKKRQQQQQKKKKRQRQLPQPQEEHEGEHESKPRKRKRLQQAPSADGQGTKKRKNDDDEALVRPKWSKTVVWSQVPWPELRLLRAKSKAYADLCELARMDAEPHLYRIAKPVIIDSGVPTLGGMYIHSGGRIVSWHKDKQVKLWDLRGSNGAMTSTCTEHIHECPQDMAWHPEGDRVFAAFKSESRAQVGFLDLAKGGFQFLEEGPHSTGNLRNIKFMPWQVCGAPCFATGGDDHSVVLWKESSQARWTSEKLYNCHSSSVYGVAGSVHKPLVCSASVDKHLRIVDVVKSKEYFSGKFESQLLAVEFNPMDPNLILLTGCAEKKQLMLLDLRYLDPESYIHSFGWETDKEPVVTRRFQQCWSLDGLYVSTGSYKDEYRIYDIRYNSDVPAQTVRGAKSSVVKVEWHPVVRNLLVTATTAGRFWLQQYCTA